MSILAIMAISQGYWQGYSTGFTGFKRTKGFDESDEFKLFEFNESCCHDVEIQRYRLKLVFGVLVTVIFMIFAARKARKNIQGLMGQGSRKGGQSGHEIQKIQSRGLGRRGQYNPSSMYARMARMGRSITQSHSFRP